MTARITSDGGAIIIRVELPAGPDAVRPIADLAKEWGIAATSLLSLAREAGILRKLGRQNVVIVSALLAAVDALGEQEPAAEAVERLATNLEDGSKAISLADIAAMVRTRPERKRKKS